MICMHWTQAIGLISLWGVVLFSTFYLMYLMLREIWVLWRNDKKSACETMAMLFVAVVLLAAALGAFVP